MARLNLRDRAKSGFIRLFITPFASRVSLDTAANYKNHQRYVEAQKERRLRCTLNYWRKLFEISWYRSALRPLQDTKYPNQNGSSTCPSVHSTAIAIIEDFDILERNPDHQIEPCSTPKTSLSKKRSLETSVDRRVRPRVIGPEPGTIRTTVNSYRVSDDLEDVEMIDSPSLNLLSCKTRIHSHENPDAFRERLNVSRLREKRLRKTFGAEFKTFVPGYSTLTYRRQIVCHDRDIAQSPLIRAFKQKVIGRSLHRAYNVKKPSSNRSVGTIPTKTGSSTQIDAVQEEVLDYSDGLPCFGLADAEPIQLVPLVPSIVIRDPNNCFSSPERGSVRSDVETQRNTAPKKEFREQTTIGLGTTTDEQDDSANVAAGENPVNSGIRITLPSKPDFPSPSTETLEPPSRNPKPAPAPRPDRSPVGLTNHKQACFNNSVLQMLYRAMDYREFRNVMAERLCALKLVVSEDADIKALMAQNSPRWTEIEARLKLGFKTDHGRCSWLSELSALLQEMGYTKERAHPFLFQKLFGYTFIVPRTVQDGNQVRGATQVMGEDVSTYDGDIQDDASEFLRELLNACKEEENELLLQSNNDAPQSSFFQDLFRIKNRKKLVCTLCGAERCIKADEGWNLELPHMDKDDTLEEMLVRKKEEADILEVQCQNPKCKGDVALSLWGGIEDAPQNIVVKVNRFIVNESQDGSFNANTMISKNVHAVTVPLDTINMRDYIATDNDNTKPINYRVSSVVRHHGISRNYGHYTAVVRQNEKYYLCNDAYVCEVPGAEMNNNTKYPLWLGRGYQRPDRVLAWNENKQKYEARGGDVFLICLERV